MSTDIDMVITDPAMPEGDGRELIAALRSRPEYRELPVLVVTAHPNDVQSDLRNGQTAVLRKPFELDDFIRWVEATASVTRSSRN